MKGNTIASESGLLEGLPGVDADPFDRGAGSSLPLRRGQDRIRPAAGDRRVQFRVEAAGFSLSAGFLKGQEDLGSIVLYQERGRAPNRILNPKVTLHPTSHGPSSTCSSVSRKRSSVRSQKVLLCSVLTRSFSSS